MAQKARKIERVKLAAPSKPRPNLRVVKTEPTGTDANSETKRIAAITSLVATAIVCLLLFTLGRLSGPVDIDLDPSANAAAQGATAGVENGNTDFSTTAVGLGAEIGTAAGVAAGEVE